MKKRTKSYRKHNEYLRKWLKAGGYAGGRCEECGEKLILLFRYDADCCPGCNRWIDPRCSDPECPFCQNRPQTPAEALEWEQDTMASPAGVVRKEYCIRQYERALRGEQRKERRIQKIQSIKEK